MDNLTDSCSPRERQRVGVVQMNSGDDWRENLLELEAGLSALSDANVTLAVTPENCLLFADRDAYYHLAKQQTVIHEKLARLCQRYSIGLVIGSFPTLTENGKLKTTSLYFDAFGQFVGQYSKMHLFDVDIGDNHQYYRESDTYEAGETPTCFLSPQGMLGLTICYDLRFSGLFEQLRAQGAELITVAAAFTEVTGEAHWRPLLIARAIEQQVWIIAAGQVGQHSQSRRTWGRSMIIDPWGRVVSELTDSPGVIWADIDHDLTQDIRQKMPVTEHRKIQATLKNSSHKEYIE